MNSKFLHYGLWAVALGMLSFLFGHFIVGTAFIGGAFYCVWKAYRDAPPT